MVSFFTALVACSAMCAVGGAIGTAAAIVAGYLMF